MIRTKFMSDEVFSQKRIFLLCVSFLAINQYFGCIHAAAAELPKVTSVRPFLGGKFLEIKGANFAGYDSIVIRPSKDVGNCDEGEEPLLLLRQNESTIVAEVAKAQQLTAGWMYLCYETKPGALLQRFGVSSRFQG